MITDLLNPKKIILNAIKDRLADTGVTMLVMKFNCDTDKYVIAAYDKDKKQTSIMLDESELNTVKKMLIAKIVKAWNKDYEDKPKAVVVEIKVVEGIIKIFIENYADQLLKFEYLS
jgi:hypothetical protein